MLFLTLLFANLTLAQELRFFAGNSQVASLSLAQLKKATKVKSVRIKSPFTKTPIKNYRALELSALLKSIFRRQLEEGNWSEVVFEATDGYKSFATLSTSLKPGGYIAFKDLDRNFGWEPVGRKRVSPAPFVLVWQGEHQTMANEYPWPWALAKISLVKFADRYPKVFPKGAKPNSAVFKGYQVFRGQCFRCHAIDNQGGKIGPDLGAPQHILDYRTEKFVRQFIREPEDFRYSKMPDFKHLSKKDMDNLMAWLKSLRH